MNKNIFQNNNGLDYFIIAEKGKRVLLKEINKGGYVIAWGLDWDNSCWTGGSYYGADEFETAVKTFLEKE